jgi:bis(5'-nucleosidyl)-tetraphosphatase
MNSREDRSFGVILVYFWKNGWEVLLVQHKSLAKHRSFPKGHPNPWEEDLTTAKREVFEETWISEKFFLFDPSKTFETEYSFSYPKENTRIHKKVFYYLAYLREKVDLHILETELFDAKYVSLDEAKKIITYDLDRNILEELEVFLFESREKRIL